MKNYERQQKKVVPPPELTTWLVSSGLLRFTQKKDSVDTIVQGRNASNKQGQMFKG